MWRGRVARHILKELREEKAAVVIQSDWRMVLARREYMRTIVAIVTIQSGFRGMVGRRYALSYKKHKAAEAIQVMITLSTNQGGDKAGFRECRIFKFQLSTLLRGIC